MKSKEEVAATMRPELRKRINKWLVSFHRLDPRYKILKFFNQVATEGADNLVGEDGIDDYDLDRGGRSSNVFSLNADALTLLRRQTSEPVDEYGEFISTGALQHQTSSLLPQPSASGSETTNTSNVSFASNTSQYQSTQRGLSGSKSRKGPSLKFQQWLSEVFNATSILTVWRPCSNDAMRKMMEGTGVGKGLDIKGKSAKRGLLSAFVPFMQIHEESDKAHVQKLYLDAKLRVYYSSKESRQTAIDTMRQYIKDGDDVPDDDKIPGTIELIDQYASKSWYGMEVSQRLFWEAYVIHQDISRSEETATGRPSTPGFQDANMKTLKIACANAAKNKNNNSNNYSYDAADEAAVPVVVQYDKEQAMRPQTLVMAYEENGTVTPVVSDFDGFLLGWRREALWFGCNLPREQEDLMMWCIDHIEAILDSDATTDTWTVRWLEILKEESLKGFNPAIPEYGFGDPKSYSIMEQAALRLIDTGAVRHGSECFNYYFPQEIDEMFLLVSDTLYPVPWKYVNVTELQSILSQKIKQGFVFPLNPKWILCDPGWKKLYDELMESKALYAEMSTDVWYPRYSGVRQKIEEVHKKHPHGFRRRKGRVSNTSQNKQDIGYSPLRRNLEQGYTLSGNAAFDLAELELEEFNHLNSKKGKLAKQIRAASMDELPWDDENDGNENDKVASLPHGADAYPQGGIEEEDISRNSNGTAFHVNTSQNPAHFAYMSKRSLFRRQREEAFADEPIIDGYQPPAQNLSRRTMYSRSHWRPSTHQRDARRNFSRWIPEGTENDHDDDDNEEKKRTNGMGGNRKG